MQGRMLAQYKHVREEREHEARAVGSERGGVRLGGAVGTAVRKVVRCRHCGLRQPRVDECRQHRCR